MGWLGWWTGWARWASVVSRQRQDPGFVCCVATEPLLLYCRATGTIQGAARAGWSA